MAFCLVFRVKVKYDIITSVCKVSIFDQIALISRVYYLDLGDKLMNAFDKLFNRYNIAQ